MSSVVSALLDNAYQDTQLLIGNDQKGDNFSTPREVEFILYSKDREKGELVASFINDNQYGIAVYEEVESSHRITTKVFMPTTQNVLCDIGVDGLFGGYL
jgi:hypothetical protein